jgi:hypothetical protein
MRGTFAADWLVSSAHALDSIPSPAPDKTDPAA